MRPCLYLFEKYVCVYVRVYVRVCVCVLRVCRRCWRLDSSTTIIYMNLTPNKQRPEEKSVQPKIMKHESQFLLLKLIFNVFAQRNSLATWRWFVCVSLFTKTDPNTKYWIRNEAYVDFYTSRLNDLNIFAIGMQFNVERYAERQKKTTQIVRISFFSCHLVQFR